MEIRFHYRGRKLQLTASAFLIIFGLSLCVPAVMALLKAFENPDADRIVFSALAAGLGLPGLGFAWFGIAYYRRLTAFFRENPWTGIRITPECTLICRYFDQWKMREIELDLQQVIRVTPKSNKGRRFLLFEMHTLPKRIIVPIEHTTPDEVHKLLAGMFADTREPIEIHTPKDPAAGTTRFPVFMTQERFHIAETLICCIEQYFAVFVQRQVQVLNAHEILIGDTNPEHKNPQLRIRNIGEGFGDTYSGMYNYQILFQLENGPVMQDGSTCLLQYSHEATDQAGSTSHFTSRMEPAEAEAFEHTFYSLLRTDIPLPPAFQLGHN